MSNLIVPETVYRGLEERLRDLEAQLQAAQAKLREAGMAFLGATDAAGNPIPDGELSIAEGVRFVRRACDELKAQLRAAEQERDALRRGLIEISTHPHCAYDHPTNLDSSGGNYGIGCADGHRCAANHAGRFLADQPARSAGETTHGE